jgi:3-oxoacyl-[acyl-carrier-protein] synthase III
MDATGEKLNIEDERSWAGSRVTRRFLPEDRSKFASARSWHDRRRLKVLGMGVALPGPPVSTAELLMRLEERFGIALLRQGTALSNRLKIRARHLSRDFQARRETPRRGHSNPDLAAAALRGALDDAQLEVGDLAYLIGHTASPACLLPPNIGLVADRLGFAGPYMELRQACTGFANALIIAAGLVAIPGIKAVAIIGSETGSVYFDPQQAVEDHSQLVNLMMMGDGAAAIIIGPDDGTRGAHISGSFFGQIGLDRPPGLSLCAGGSEKPFVDGETLRFEHDFAAVRAGGLDLFNYGVAAARALGIGLDTVDYLIPHQANGRMAELLSPFLGVKPERVFVNAEDLGNTGSAAIWLALAELRKRLRPGASVLALGAEATKYMFGGFHYVHG